MSQQGMPFLRNEVLGSGRQGLWRLLKFEMLAEGKGAAQGGLKAMAWTSSPQEGGCICKQDIARGKGRVFGSLLSRPCWVCAGAIASEVWSSEQGRCLRAQQRVSRLAGRLPVSQVSPLGLAFLPFRSGDLNSISVTPDQGVLRIKCNTKSCHSVWLRACAWCDCGYVLLTLSWPLKGPPALSPKSHILDIGFTPTGEEAELSPHSGEPHDLPDPMCEVGHPEESCLSPECCGNQAP